MSRETMEYIFLRCEWARPVRFGLQLGYVLMQNNNNSFNPWPTDWLEEIKKYPDYVDHTIMLHPVDDLES